MMEGNPLGAGTKLMPRRIADPCHVANGVTPRVSIRLVYPPVPVSATGHRVLAGLIFVSKKKKLDTVYKYVDATRIHAVSMLTRKDGGNVLYIR
jgi:hypothetical protein